MLPNHTLNKPDLKNYVIPMKELTVFLITLTVSVSSLILPTKAAMVNQGIDLTQNPLNKRDSPNSQVDGTPLTEISDSTSEATDPFELMQSEGFGKLKLSLTAAQVFELLGSPETKGEMNL